LANWLGISNSCLSKIENGLDYPGSDLLKKYSEVFNVPVSAIVIFSDMILSDPSKKMVEAKLRILEADKIFSKRVILLFRKMDETEKLRMYG
jgi:transcriptional regulator with XRE-family HTH domain